VQSSQCITLVSTEDASLSGSLYIQKMHGGINLLLLQPRFPVKPLISNSSIEKSSGLPPSLSPLFPVKVN